MGLTHTPAQPLVAVYECGCRSNSEPYYQHCPLHTQPVRYSYVSHGLGDITGLTHYCLDPQWIDADDGKTKL